MENKEGWDFENPCDLVRFIWNDSTKNDVALAYCEGFIEALFWAKRITTREATSLNNYLTK